MDHDAYVFRNKLVFVMGMQRSGTTALAETLGQDSRIHVEHESPGNDFYDNYFLRPEAEIRDKLWRIKRRVLLKPISETQRRSVEETLEEFADYGVRVAWIYRDPVNVWSSMQVEFQLTEADRHGWAWQWNQGNRSVLDALYGPHRERIALVRYEDLIAHRATYAALCRFLEIEERCNLFWRADANKGRRRLDDALQQAIEADCAETLAELDRRRLFVHWATGRPPLGEAPADGDRPQQQWSIGQVDPPAAVLETDPAPTSARLHFVLPRKQWQTSVQLLRSSWSVRKAERYSWGFWARASLPQTVGVGLGQHNWPRLPLVEPTGIELTADFAWHTGQMIVNRDEEQAHLWLDIRRPKLREHASRMSAHLRRAVGLAAAADLELCELQFVHGDLPVYRFEFHQGAQARAEFDPLRPSEVALRGLRSPRRMPSDLKFITHELELTAGQTYLVSLRIKAAARRPAALAVGLAESPWTAWRHQRLTLTSDWQTLHWAVTPKTTDRVRVYLELGEDEADVTVADADVQQRTLPQMHLAHRPGCEAILRPAPHDGQLVRVDGFTGHAQRGPDVQLCQYLDGIDAGRRYAVSLRVRADAPRRAALGVHQSVEPWQNLGLQKRLELQTVWQQFYYEFEATLGDDAPRLHLDLGDSPTPVECSLVECLPIDAQLAPEELERIRRLLNRVQLGQARAVR